MTANELAIRIEKIRFEAQSPAELQLMMQQLQLEVLCELLSGVRTSKDGMMTDIAAFHEKFQLDYDGAPREMTEEMASFRVKFLQEELDEFKEAFSRNDLEKQFDALIDLVYVALGTAYQMGLPFKAGWNRVHMANMQKVRSKAKVQILGQRDIKFGVIKPPDWRAPDLSDLIGTPKKP